MHAFIRTYAHTVSFHIYVIINIHIHTHTNTDMYACIGVLKQFFGIHTQCLYIYACIPVHIYLQTQICVHVGAWTHSANTDMCTCRTNTDMCTCRRMNTQCIGIRTTHDALLHSALKRCASGLECTQHSVHSKSWALKCTQHSVHLKQWALGTQCHSPYRHWVLSACIVCGPMCPWAPLSSLGLSLSLSAPHLGLVSSWSFRLCLSLRRLKAYWNLRARTGISC